MAQSLSIFQTLNHCRLLSRRSEGRITYQSIDCKLRSDCLNKLFHRDFQTVRIARGKSQSAAICMFCAKRWCQQKCFTRISSTVAKTNQKQRSFLKKKTLQLDMTLGSLQRLRHPSTNIHPPRSCLCQLPQVPSMATGSTVIARQNSSPLRCYVCQLSKLRNVLCFDSFYFLRLS